MGSGPGQCCLVTRCPVLQLILGSECDVPHGVCAWLMGRGCKEDPQVSGVGFVCTVAFLTANVGTLLGRQNSPHTTKLPVT